MTRSAQPRSAAVAHPRRSAIWQVVTFIAACGTAWPLHAAEETAPRPNLIVIMADDLGAKELGCYGHPVHRTPRLDQLARSGVFFETCYSTPICHSTRFEIMTGQYGHHNRVWNFAGRRGGPEPDAPEENIGENHLTFAEILKEAGYATALAGKWQLSGAVPTLVHECGFDEYLMWAYKHNLPPGVQHTGGWEKQNVKTARFWHPSLVRNGQYVPTEADDYGPDMFADFIIDFIRRHRDQPFLVYYPMTLTHGPFYSTPATTRNTADRRKNSKSNFQANVEYMDHIVGRLVDALDKMGLRNETVVFFTGDNGTGGDGKGQPTELGARVPMIVNGPGWVKKQGASKELVDLSDILPTLAEFGRAPIPTDRPIDGRSFAHQLRGQPGPSREWIYSYIADRRILRDQRWLLEDNSPHQPGRLYHCGQSRDGTEYQDVTGSEDPEVRAARARFEKILAAHPAPDIPYLGKAAGKKRRVGGP